MQINALYEGFLYGLIFPLSGDPLFFAMREFGAPHEQLWFVALWHTVGFALAQAVNWGIGYLLLKGRERHKDRFHLSDAYYALAVKGFRWALPLLLFAWYGVGGVLMVVAGFLRVPIGVAVAVAAAGRLGYYAYYLM